MIPPTHFATPPGEVATGTPPLVGGDTLSKACARALNAPVIVTDIGDGALLVEPLRFHPVVRSKSGVKVCKHFHVHPTATKGRSNNV